MQVSGGIASDGSSTSIVSLLSGSTYIARWDPFLATTASISPFIVLFCTVWGILIAFFGIAQTGSTNLNAVAPGIAEALVTTAAGLLAAIPAVLFYNYFSQRVKTFASG